MKKSRTHQKYELLLLIPVVLIIVITIIVIVILNNKPTDSEAGSNTNFDPRAASESYTEKYPIIKDLPIVVAEYDAEYNYTEYRIDGGKDSLCSENFCLYVTDYTGAGLDAARQTIKDKGYNPDDFEIHYDLVYN